MPSEPKQKPEEKDVAQAPAPVPEDKSTDKQKYSRKAKPARRAGSAPARPNPGNDIYQPGSGPLSAIGQGLYLLGFYAECKAVQIWRVLRIALGLLGQLLAWAFGGIFRAVGRFLKGIFYDLVAPFHRFFVGLRNVRKVMSEEKERGSENAQKTALKYFGSGVRTYLYLVGNLIKFFLPIAAAFVFGFTVYSVLNLEYNLEVRINGQVVGVIADEATFEEARNTVRQRIVAADDMGAENWIVVPEYRLTGVGSLTPRDQLSNNMLFTYDTSDGLAPVDATGIVVDGQLFVTDDGEAVHEFLEDLKAQYYVGEGVDVDFVQEVSYDLEAEDLFFASSVRSAEEVQQALMSVVQEEETYTATGQENLSDIAHDNGMALSVLLDYNPDLSYDEWAEEDEDEENTTTGAAATPNEDDDEGEEGEGGEELEPGGEYVPAPGTQLIVQPEKRLLQVQTSRVVYEEEVIPYTTYHEDNPDLYKGQSRTVQVGVNGLQRVPYEIISIDGIETKLPVEDVEPEIIEYPVDEIIHDGVYEFNYETLTGNYEGSAAYIWPVPVYTRQGRGMVNGHRGADINANYGEAILSIAGGTVVEAGWHYSFGNHVVIDHGNGVQSLYAHSSELLVNVGDEVGQGAVIALIGSTGNSTGNHLHIEITINGTRVEPYTVISPP